MSDQKRLQLELDGDSATLCVHGPLAGAAHDRSMIDLCEALPSQVRTLHVDLRALGAMSGEATGAVRTLLAHWRTTRGGEFRLITSHLLATCTPAPAVAASRAALHVVSARSEAMTAAFLGVALDPASGAGRSAR